MPCLLKTLKVEMEVLEIRLNLGIVEVATNNTFCIEVTRIQILILSENMKRQIDVHVMEFKATWFFAEGVV